MEEKLVINGRNTSNQWMEEILVINGWKKN